MIEINGGFGEGGGQILRTSIALTFLLGEKLKIYNIRKKRPESGLAQQHLVSLEAIKNMTDSTLKGVHLGSDEIIFHPGSIIPGKYKIDVGTAGSISLVLQTILPICLFSSQPTELILRGGTDVKWSPPIDYLKNVFLRILGKMGGRVDIKIERRGYFPKGGGTIRTIVYPIEKLSSLNLLERGNLQKVRGIVHSSNLPSHITERIVNSVDENLNYPSEIKMEQRNEDSTGVGINLWAVFKNSYIGAGSLGEINKSAEKVGKEAALRLASELKNNTAIDAYTSDQIILYLALAKGISKVRVANLTSHLITNIHVVEKILGVKFRITDKYVLNITGIGFNNDLL
tara:strand:+ start:4661 stop:5689 length:1029 start_codon:yes stop_codon:yes gene_type:complete